MHDIVAPSLVAAGAGPGLARALPCEKAGPMCVRVPAGLD
jgi:hypothetical protein